VQHALTIIKCVCVVCGCYSERTTYQPYCCHQRMQNVTKSYWLSRSWHCVKSLVLYLLYTFTAVFFIEFGESVMWRVIKVSDVFMMCYCLHSHCQCVGGVCVCVVLQALCHWCTLNWLQVLWCSFLGLFYLLALTM